MTDPTTPTFASSLALLTEAVGKASDDLRAVHAILQHTGTDVAPGASVERAMIAAATRAIDRLRDTDEALRDVVKAIESRG